ncbi:MAG: hypothetical protein VST71_05160 [Nitrospirota bacterium]|nr:hypothetical protein [Nitrospirota bacterium]
MPVTSLKDKLIAEIDDLPEKKVREVMDFIGYLKLKEDEWFIDFVNKRGGLAKAERKAGKKLTKLEELQKEYR